MGKIMKASVLHEPGKFVYEDVPVPTLGENDVLIKVAYAGICGSDLPRGVNINGARKYPLILGHEFSGTITEIGSKVDSHKVGEKVAVAPLIPDPNSPYTKAGEYGLSDNYNIIGTGSNGAFAEFVKVPEGHVISLPDNLDLETAAGVEPATISFHALARSGIEVGDTVAVLGCGPIGQFAVQSAKVFGAGKVIAVDIFDDKLALAKELGADVTINSKNEDLLARIKKETGLGVHVVIETAGSKITQAQALLITRKHGKIVYVGISHSELTFSAKAAERILRAELIINGSWNSYTAPYPGRAWEATLDNMSKGKILFKPMISHHIQLEELGEYIPNMFKRNFSFNKVLVAVNSK